MSQYYLSHLKELESEAHLVKYRLRFGTIRYSETDIGGEVASSLMQETMLDRSSPYENPDQPNVIVQTDKMSEEDAISLLLKEVEERIKL